MIFIMKWSGQAVTGACTRAGQGGGERTEPGDPRDMKTAGLMTNPREGEGESVLPLTSVDDEHTQSRRRQCIPVQTAKNHKAANTLLPVLCDFRHPKRTKPATTQSSKHRGSGLAPTGFASPEQNPCRAPGTLSLLPPHSATSIRVTPGGRDVHSGPHCHSGSHVNVSKRKWNDRRVVESALIVFPGQIICRF